MQEGVYKIQSKMHKYEMIVSQSGKEYDIYFGRPASREGPCVHLLVKHDDPWAKLHNIAHASDCSQEGLEKGDGTVDMLRSAFAIVFSKFPWVRRIWFHDVSEFAVALRGTFHNTETNISLVHHYMLLHGRTWYEAKFGAKPRSATRQVLKGWDVLKSPPRDAMRFATLWECLATSTAGKLRRMDEEVVKKIYSSAQDFHSLFLLVKDVYGVEAFDNSQEIVLRTLGVPSLLYTPWYIAATRDEKDDKMIKHNDKISVTKSKESLEHYRKRWRRGGGAARKIGHGMVCFTER